MAWIDEGMDDVLTPARLVRFLTLSKPSNMYLVQCILDHVVLLAFIDFHSTFLIFSCHQGAHLHLDPERTHLIFVVKNQTACVGWPDGHL